MFLRRVLGMLDAKDLRDPFRSQIISRAGMILHHRSGSARVATATGGTRSDWLMAALLKAERGLTTVQLQKSLFVLGERRKKLVGAGYYQFNPYNYGPFCRDIYDDADKLRVNGLVDLDASRGHSTREFRLTESGRATAQQVVSSLPPDGVSYLAEVVAWAQSLSFNDLVRAIYEAFPSMKANSVFQD